MKTIPMTLRLSALALGLVSTASVLAAEEATYTLDLAEHPDLKKLSIVVRSGDVSIQTNDGSVIVVTGESSDDSDGRPPRPPAPGMRSLLSNGADNTGVGLRAEIGKTEVRFTQMMPGSGDIKVEMPAKMSVDVSLIDGDLSVNGIQGESTFRTVSGDINANSIGGSVVAESVDGNVSFMFTDTYTFSSSFHSVDGNVELTLPKNLAANFEMVTVDGDVVTDLPIEVTDSSNMAGRQSVRGKLNGGGETIKVATVDGNVTIRSSK